MLKQNKNALINQKQDEKEVISAKREQDIEKKEVTIAKRETEILKMADDLSKKQEDLKKWKPYYLQEKRHFLEKKKIIKILQKQMLIKYGKKMVIWFFKRIFTK